ncbi:hypothetical protein DQ04_02341000 [Trypanosoma grayi]|uniref:hypothetical protein n=1 Tax=Trypanosoma grayi TaxID=71804 RepID=UPI0004F43E3D|nr:hypothetical protein DQ04_02341000 [Trypanosoma grayi]KEG11715.1 hypothetical protein DQ04_02341000 [Trypanosoma grayi]
MPITSDAGATRSISSVCTMGTPECDDELHLFLRCLRTFHTDIPVIVGCTSEMVGMGGQTVSKAFSQFREDRRIEWVPCLDQYLSINRSAMEKQRGVWYPSRHADFMMEKTNLMERAMLLRERYSDDKNAAVAFFDCDVVLLGALPRLPAGTEVALSPHRICRRDEALFGRYNGGFVVATNPLVLHEWRRATQYSRFFDQASLESVAGKFASTMYEFPPQHNYGYWRFFQSYREDPLLEARQFSIAPMGARRQWTLCYEGAPLGSIHTHFLLHAGQKQPQNIRAFNGLMKKLILKCIRPSPGRGAAAMCTAGLAAAENAGYRNCFDIAFLASKP